MTDVEVWAHPDAEEIFRGFNMNRKTLGSPPLTRGMATEAVRQQIAKNDQDRRQPERWKWKRPTRQME